MECSWPAVVHILGSLAVYRSASMVTAKIAMMVDMDRSRYLEEAYQEHRPE